MIGEEYEVIHSWPFGVVGGMSGVWEALKNFFLGPGCGSRIGPRRQGPKSEKGLLETKCLLCEIVRLWHICER
jgi:hypothetical protein